MERPIRPTRGGYKCIKACQIVVDQDTFTYEPDDYAPAHIVAGFDRRTRQEHFIRNPDIRGEVRA